MTTSLPTKRRQELLTNGYIRNNSHELHIPRELMNLCLSFHNENIHIIVKLEKLRKLLSLKHQPQPDIYSKIMKYKDINFICNICPAWNSQGWIIFNVQMMQIKQNIKSIRYIFKVCCPQIKAISHKTKSKRGSSINDVSFIGCSKSSLILSQCDIKDELEFIYNIKISNIEYKDGTKYIDPTE